MKHFAALVQARRSVRAYTSAPVEREKIEAVLFAAAQAPSGKNGQPWRFILVQNDKQLLGSIAALMQYSKFMRKADALVLVFLDSAHSYHAVKDAQAVGACIENMLLQCTDLGLGACWVGEVLAREAQIKRLVGAPDGLSLMAAVALGYPADRRTVPAPKQDLQTLVLRDL